ncbi:hypothetical protein EBR66_01425 [bacterium]|nr:hypothetical protein [bacterium]
MSDRKHIDSLLKHIREYKPTLLHSTGDTFLYMLANNWKLILHDDSVQMSAQLIDPEEHRHDSCDLGHIEELSTSSSAHLALGAYLFDEIPW